MDFDAILDQILVSDEDQLSKINTAVKQRREILQARVMDAIKINDIVVMNDKTRPKYLQGCFAKVKKVNKTTVGLEMLPGYTQQARKYGKGTFRCPISLVNLQDTET